MRIARKCFKTGACVLKQVLVVKRCPWFGDILSYIIVECLPWRPGTLFFRVRFRFVENLCFLKLFLIGQKTLFFVILKIVVYKSLSINVLCGSVFLRFSVCLLSSVLFFRDDAANVSSCSQA